MTSEQQTDSAPPVRRGAWLGVLRALCAFGGCIFAVGFTRNMEVEQWGGVFVCLLLSVGCWWITLETPDAGTQRQQPGCADDMKKTMQRIGAAGLLFAGVALSGGGQDTPKTIPARLEWTVTTNWSAAYQTRTLMGWMGDKDPNATTYHETGTIQSNLVAYVEWKGKVSGVVIETIYVGTANRSYILSESVRVYR